MTLWPWKSQPKTNFDPVSYQVIVTLSRKWALSQSKFPDKLIKRTSELLETKKLTGEIQSYVLFENRLRTTWTALRHLVDEEDDFSIDCIVAGAYPKLEGVKVVAVKPEKDPIKTIAILTIRAPRQTITQWQLEWLEACIIERLRSAGVTDTPHIAQLEATLLRAAAGESTNEVPVLKKPDEQLIPNEGVAKANFTISANHTRKEVYVLSSNPWFIRRAHADQEIFSSVQGALDKFARARGAEYKIRRSSITSAMQKARNGTEAVGIDLPLVILAGGTFRLGEITRPVGYAGQGRLFLDISEDKMSAKISRFTEKLYDDDSFEKDQSWLKNEFNRLGISTAVSNENIKAALEILGKKESLNGFEIAKGLPPTGGKEPFLFLSYKESPLSEGNENAKVDMREIQQRTIVRAGTIIAEIRYKHPGADGFNVFGEAIPKLESEPFEVTLGEGIETTEDGKFRAQFDGVPAVEGNNLTLAKAYVVNGDVNLRVGNIRFDGPVEIKGSIDTGAIVECTGPLVVEQSILGAKVRSKTTVDVKGSITMGGQGHVIAKESIDAEFVENAKLQCNGEIRAKKAILNSEVLAGKGIEITEGGGIAAGGTLICRGNLKTGNLGFKNGAQTVVHCGGDFRTELAVSTRKSRLESLQAYQEVVRNNVKELNSKSPSQLTEKTEALRQKFLRQQSHLKKLVEKAQAHLRAAENNVTYDSKSKILVANLLSTNCRIEVSGQSIPIENEVIGAAIQSKPRKGSHIVALNEADTSDSETNSEEKAAS